MTQQIKTIVGEKSLWACDLLNLSFKNNNDQLICTTECFLTSPKVQPEEMRRQLEEGEQIIGIYGNDNVRSIGFIVWKPAKL